MASRDPQRLIDATQSSARTGEPSCQLSLAERTKV